MQEDYLCFISPINQVCYNIVILALQISKKNHIAYYSNIYLNCQIMLYLMSHISFLSNAVYKKSTHDTKTLSYCNIVTHGQYQDSVVLQYCYSCSIPRLCHTTTSLLTSIPRRCHTTTLLLTSIPRHCHTTTSLLMLNTKMLPYYNIVTPRFCTV